VLPTLLAAALLLLSADPAPPTYEITAKRGEVQVLEGGSRLEVTSAFGIGTAAIRLKEGEWPKKLTLVFKLQELEGVTLRNDRLDLRTNRRAEYVEVRQKEGEAWKEAASRPEQKIVVRGGAGKIEVEVPVVLLDRDTRQLEIHWVDYYRG